jgi:hypothetical protein
MRAKPQSIVVVRSFEIGSEALLVKAENLYRVLTTFVGRPVKAHSEAEEA